VVVIDDFFSEEGLQELRNFLLESTMWMDVKRGEATDIQLENNGTPFRAPYRGYGWLRMVTGMRVIVVKDRYWGQNITDSSHST
jgi:hypothetical protein